MNGKNLEEIYQDVDFTLFENALGEEHLRSLFQRTLLQTFMSLHVCMHMYTYAHACLSH